MEIGFLRVNSLLFPNAGVRSVVAASAWVVGVVSLRSSISVAVSLQLGMWRIAVLWLKRTRFAWGWVPSVRCTRGVPAAPSTVAIRVFQRGLRRSYIRGERWQGLVTRKERSSSSLATGYHGAFGNSGKTNITRAPSEQSFRRTRWMSDHVGWRILLPRTNRN